MSTKLAFYINLKRQHEKKRRERVGRNYASRFHCFSNEKLSFIRYKKGTSVNLFFFVREDFMLMLINLLLKGFNGIRKFLILMIKT